MRPDALAAPQPSHEVTVPAGANAKIGWTHLGLSEEFFDLGEERLLHAPHYVGYSLDVKRRQTARSQLASADVREGMYAKGWRERLAAELERANVSMRQASKAADMHDGWVSELLNKGKDPTIEPFTRMCIEKGLRLGYILTGEGKSAEEERFGALFGNLDPDVQDGLKAMMLSMSRGRSQD